MKNLDAENDDRARAKEWQARARMSNDQMGRLLGGKGRFGYEKWIKGGSENLRNDSHRRLRDILSRDPESFNLDSYLVETNQKNAPTGDPALFIANELDALAATLRDPGADHTFKVKRLLAFVNVIHSEKKALLVKFGKFAEGDTK